MEARVKTRNVRASPTKVRLVVDLIRGKKVEEALNLLEFSGKRSAKTVKDSLKSAIANAENNLGLDVDTLFVSRAFVDSGPQAKRFRPCARGRAARILKRSSHVTLVVSAGK